MKTKFVVYNIMLFVFLLNSTAINAEEKEGKEKDTATAISLVKDVLDIKENDDNKSASNSAQDDEPSEDSAENDDKDSSPIIDIDIGLGNNNPPKDEKNDKNKKEEHIPDLHQEKRKEQKKVTPIPTREVKREDESEDETSVIPVLNQKPPNDSEPPVKTTSEETDVLSENINIPANLLNRTVAGQYYNSEDLSRSATAFLVSVAVLLFSVGFGLVKSKSFTFTTAYRKSLSKIGLRKNQRNEAFSIPYMKLH